MTTKQMRKFFLFLLLCAPAFCQTPVGVLTYHNDNARSGANLNETQLTLANVVVGSFGKLFELNVDGVVYAQPLYMSGLNINGAVHNVVFVATENNSVYAFDGDTGAQLWTVNFNYGPAGTTVTPVPDADINCTNLAPVVGITSTPVIDPSARVLYTVAKSKEVSSSATNYFHRLHGVNILTGKEVFPQVAITASVPGTCGNPPNGTIVFNPLLQHQRASLLLLNDVVYIGSASHCDNGAYYGWLLGYNTSTQQQVAALNTAPDGTTQGCRAGIWQGGGGPAADNQGNVFVLTGNGAFTANKGGHSYGDSALRLSTDSNGALTVGDYFTPMNQHYLTDQDLDFAGSGASLILPKQPGPHPDLMVAAGKIGNIYLINRNNMGKFDPKGDRVIQTIPGAVGDGTDAFPPPVYFHSNVYWAGSKDALKGFTLTNGLFGTTPFAKSANTFGYLGAGLSVSAAPDGERDCLGTGWHGISRRSARLQCPDAGRALQLKPGCEPGRQFWTRRQTVDTHNCQRQSIRRHPDQCYGLRFEEYKKVTPLFLGPELPCLWNPGRAL